jgi:hypothetical protein
MRLPDDTLYLPIKQVFFDAIIAGSKTVEHREVPGYPLASRYLIKSKGPSHYALNPDCTVPGMIYDWNDYNGGRYPFLPRPFKRLYMAVGYASDRDTAIVEIKAISFHPERIMKDKNGNPCFCFWVMDIHLGQVRDVYRAKRKK